MDKDERLYYEIGKLLEDNQVTNDEVCSIASSLIINIMKRQNLESIDSYILILKDSILQHKELHE